MTPSTPVKCARVAERWSRKRSQNVGIPVNAALSWIVTTMPLSLLYQQTMSILRSRTELKPAQLAQAVLKLSPFKAITLEDYRLFLQHLVALDHLQQMDEGTLIVGMKGERLSSYYHFYAIFASEQECRVLAGTQEVGVIQQLPEVDSVIGLAGYAWRVISVDERGRIVHVERAKGSVTPGWLSMGRLSFHERMMQRVRQVLQEETVYLYPSPLAQQRLTIKRYLDELHLACFVNMFLMPRKERVYQLIKDQLTPQPLG